jgi:hypothetical protein
LAATSSVALSWMAAARIGVPVLSPLMACD